MGGCGEVSSFPWTNVKAQIHKYIMFLSIIPGDLGKFNRISYFNIMVAQI